jgi:hypothetical protein
MSRDEAAILPLCGTLQGNRLILGHLNIEAFLTQTKGEVTGRVITDAKDRVYQQTYRWSDAGDGFLNVRRSDGAGDTVKVARRASLDEGLIAFFGLYSGDGAKGSEAANMPGRIVPTVSFSQKEPNLVRFAVDQFRKLFSGEVHFVFALGEDSAFFMAGEGAAWLNDYYRAQGLEGSPAPRPLRECRGELNDADRGYLGETRQDVARTNEEHLAFYYSHKAAMEAILTRVKEGDLARAGVALRAGDRVTASLRRPFKKGARQPGGSSRSDEIHVGGLNGFGEFFLKMLHEIEDSILRDATRSASGLVEWIGIPSQIGESLDVRDFFTNQAYGQIANRRPVRLEELDAVHLVGQWPRSGETLLLKRLRVDPLWSYTSGLYLAEGTTEKAKLFRMFAEAPGSLALGFTSSEGASLELMLRTLHKLFPVTSCLDAWKVKVGSQYFPELVVTGLKNGVFMLRGGASGDGKLRTMEISLAIRDWGLAVADDPLQHVSLLREHYANKFSHVEPTGAGVARIDFWCSSSLCRWYFPLLMYTVFGEIIVDPCAGFYR